MPTFLLDALKSIGSSIVKHPPAFVLAALGLVGTFFKRHVLSSLLTAYVVPGWQLVLIVSAAPFVIWLRKELGSTISDKYFKDVFDELGDIEWRWKWAGERPYPIEPHCPRCKHELVRTPTSADWVDRYVCENCRFKSKSFRGEPSELIKSVERHIKRHRAENTWVKWKDRVKAAKKRAETEPSN